MLPGVLNHTVTLTPKATLKYDAYGKATGGTAATYSARCQFVQKRIVTPNKVEVAVILEVWFDNNVAVEVDDSITWESNAYHAVSVEKKYDFFGAVDFIKVFCS